MRISLELSEQDLRKLVLEHIRKELLQTSINLEDIRIQVKSKNNFKAEWEQASYRAIVEKNQHDPIL